MLIVQSVAFSGISDPTLNDPSKCFLLRPKTHECDIYTEVINSSNLSLLKKHNEFTKQQELHFIISLTESSDIAVENSLE